MLKGLAESGLGHSDAAIDQMRQALDFGYRTYQIYAFFSGICAVAGKMDQAQTALAEARRLNPILTVKWMIDHTSAGRNPDPTLLDGLRKAGLPEE
jgi:hypothetical protein